MSRYFPILILFSVSILSCTEDQEDPGQIHKIVDTIKIDGIANEKTWKSRNWRVMDQNWLGKDYTSADFSGKYKISWGEKYLYILAEITDDKLIDIHPDGLVNYWDDDCLEVFVDENNSKGIHLYNHSAFAYHIALDGRVTDIGTDSLPHYYNDHVINARKTEAQTSTWELAIELHNDKFKDGQKTKPVKLVKGKRIGFAIAYCDNDHSNSRENFIGSIEIQGEDKNQGYINAGIFREMKLVP